MNRSNERHRSGVGIASLSIAVLASGVLPACGADAEPAPGAPERSSAGRVEGFTPEPEGPVSTSLSCDEPFIDFGDVFEGAILSHRFVLQAGAQETSVAATRADCGCTVAELQLELPASTDDAPAARAPYVDGAPIPAGARLLVDVTYDPRGKRGRAPRTISLYTPEGRAEVSIEANVSPWLSVEPERADLPLMRDSDVAETSYRVMSIDGTPFELTHLTRGVPPEVAVTLAPIRPDADGRAFEWDVHAVLGPNMPRGPHIYPIELLTDQLLPQLDADGVRPAIRATAYLTVRVVGAVSLDPPTMMFGVVDPLETVSRTLRVRCHDPEFVLPAPQVELVSMRPVPEGESFALAKTATVQVLAVEGENAWDVQLVLSGLDTSIEGTFLGKLIVATGHPAEARIEANVSGIAVVGGGGR